MSTKTRIETSTFVDLLGGFTHPIDPAAFSVFLYPLYAAVDLFKHCALISSNIICLYRSTGLLEAYLSHSTKYRNILYVCKGYIGYAILLHLNSFIIKKHHCFL